MSIYGFPACCGASVLSGEISWTDPESVKECTDKFKLSGDYLYKGVGFITLTHPIPAVHEELLKNGWVEVCNWKGQYKQGYRAPYNTLKSDHYPMVMYALIRTPWEGKQDWKSEVAPTVEAA